MIVSPFTFNHEIMGEGFYLVDVEIPRLSEWVDIIPVMVSERLMDVESDMVGTEINITGQFRSYNRHDKKNGNRLQLFVFAQEICLLEQDSEEVEAPDGSKSNQIELKGYICKKTVYRKTPLGREIGVMN